MEKPKPKRVTAVMTYEDRKAKGRPLVSLSLTAEAVEDLRKVAEFRGLNRSALVAALLVEEKRRKKID